MSSPAPKRRLDVRHQSSVRASDQAASSRRAAPRRARRSFRPSMAMVGAVALVLAGLGSAVVSSRADSGTLGGDYQALSADVSDGGFDVSRSGDRELLEEQTQAQADQLLQAQQDLQVATQAKADELKANQWVLPVTGYRITGRYGVTNSLWGKGHSGLDFAGPSGSTISSIASGTVIAARYSGNCGNMTQIKLDAEDIVLMYCHQSRQTVSEGQHVLAGETIGYTGSTGRSTGPHLHVEVKPGGGKSVDPEPYFNDHNVYP
ncbi:M23 family metallopeptidase [Aeromicrobium sp. Leaf350]|uniref:M23 family metallopeptidase n=1 Tax=Aeromicrobium sp. Leaf350 TaxID=2876565 RepID=UPI001E4E7D61|nr:M23 family metallopeptidase [Aeromicrobium sp. Leaf350]